MVSGIVIVGNLLGILETNPLGIRQFAKSWPVDDN